jgi:group I intron endonuclease
VENNANGKCYVGSAVDLSKRLYNYYNIAFLANQLSKGNSAIYNALLKYGYSSFSLIILEYCDTSLLLKREQFYIDTLKPEYNLAQNAAAPFLGRNHTENSSTNE